MKAIAIITYNSLFYFHQEDQVHQIEELGVILGILRGISEDGYPVGVCFNFSLDYQEHSDTLKIRRSCC